jgi:hypothetical protein
MWKLGNNVPDRGRRDGSRKPAKMRNRRALPAHTPSKQEMPIPAGLGLGTTAYVQNTGELDFEGCRPIVRVVP